MNRRNHEETIGAARITPGTPRLAISFRPTVLHRIAAALPAACVLVTVTLGYGICLEQFARSLY